MKYDIDSIKKRKNLYNKIKLIVGAVLIIIIYNLILLAISYISEIDNPGLFGYKAYVITTSSMEPSIHIGDVVVVKKNKEEKLGIGDIISFKENEEIITHRIINIEEKEGKKHYITKGDNNNTEDTKKTIYEDIAGRTVMTVPYLGNIVNIIKNRILVLFIILIFLICYLYKIIKEEKNEDRREKKKIEDKKFFNK